MDRENFTNSLILIWNIFKTSGELKIGFSLPQRLPSNLFNEIINCLNYNCVMDQESQLTLDERSSLCNLLESHGLKEFVFSNAHSTEFKVIASW